MDQPQNCESVIPIWLTNRLKEYTEKPPAYEASWYGPLNVFLNSYFPGHKGFMVKPQPRLRLPPEPGATRSSIDSYGQEVGRSEHDFIPDFIACVAAGIDDVPIVILEAKRSTTAEIEVALQIDSYIEWARKYLEEFIPHGGDVTILAMATLGHRCIVQILSAQRKSDGGIGDYDVWSNTFERLDCEAVHRLLWQARSENAPPTIIRA